MRPFRHADTIFFILCGHPCWNDAAFKIPSYDDPVWHVHRQGLVHEWATGDCSVRLDGCPQLGYHRLPPVQDNDDKTSITKSRWSGEWLVRETLTPTAQDYDDVHCDRLFRNTPCTLPSEQSGQLIGFGVSNRTVVSGMTAFLAQRSGLGMHNAVQLSAGHDRQNWNTCHATNAEKSAGNIANGCDESASPESAAATVETHFSIHSVQDTGNILGGGCTGYGRGRELFLHTHDMGSLCTEWKGVWKPLDGVLFKERGGRHAAPFASPVDLQATLAYFVKAVVKTCAYKQATERQVNGTAVVRSRSVAGGARSCGYYRQHTHGAFATQMP